MALPILQPALAMASLSSSSRTPSAEYVATRLHSIANYKLRLESSQNEPVLRKLLGHIFVYDAIREHHQSHSVYTSPAATRRRQQQLRLRKQSERSSSLSTVEDDAETTESSTNAKDISNFLSTLPTNADIPPSSVQDFITFQQAIASQLATLSQLRLQNASRQLYNMTQGTDGDDDDAELAVEEYDSDDLEDDSDYDSYDGDDRDWRFEDGQRDDEGESDTDAESVPSEPPSPTEGEVMAKHLEREESDDYFAAKPQMAVASE